MTPISEPRLPEVGEFVRGVGTLVEVQQTPAPPPPPPDYIFAEQDGRTELRRGDDVLKVIQTLNDFYGKGAGVETSIEEAKQYAVNHNITDASEVEVVVVKVVSYSRSRNSHGKNFYDNTFVDFKTLDSGATWDVPGDEETDVWSSKRGDIA